MRFYPTFVLFLCVVVLLGSCAESESLDAWRNQYHDLEAEWSLNVDGFDTTLDANVPGTAQADLIAAGLLPDPFVNQNLDSFTAHEDASVYYRTTFRVDDRFANNSLVFESIDTEAEIILDGKTYEHHNMFVPLEIPILKSDLDEHELEVRITSPVTAHLEKSQLFKYDETAGNDEGDPRVAPYTRKAQYQFGWDWAPRLVSSGLAGPVKLRQWSVARLKDSYVRTLSLTDDEARIEYVVQLEADRNVDVNLTVAGTGGDTSFAVPMGEGVQEIRFEQTIQKPKRWWPATLGEQHLYIDTLLLSVDGFTRESEALRYGLRTINLVQQPDSIGTSYYFEVNGFPVFMKGANYVPPTVFSHETATEKIRSLIEEASNSGMNMLRVWGGGVYASDAFYDYCDEYGLLVWQDFMFACAMYPADPDFVANVQQEANWQVQRLRRHPSLALWCGNNEVDVAWHNWGFQSAYDIHDLDSVNMYADYERIFTDVLPTAVRENQPELAYVHTSPLSNWGTPENFNHSSMHYWGVWHGEDKFEAFADNVPRFMVEYGYQSYPENSVVQTFSSQPIRSINDSAFIHRQKSYKGNRLLSTHIQQYYPEPDSLEEWLYVNQLVQARAYDLAVRSHLGSNGHCMGTLYWQFNDCWPGPSWSTIDYFGQAKAAHYRVSNLYRNGLIPVLEGNTLKVDLMHSGLGSLAGQLSVAWYDFDGNLIWSQNQEVSIAAMKEGQIRSNQHFEFSLPNLDMKNGYFQISGPVAYSFVYSDEASTSYQYFPVIPKELNLPAPDFSLESEWFGDDLEVTVTARSFVKDLYLYFEDYDPREGVIRWSDNYVNVEKHNQYVVTVEGDKQQLEKLRNSLRAMCVGPKGEVFRSK